MKTILRVFALSLCLATAGSLAQPADAEYNLDGQEFVRPGARVYTLHSDIVGVDYELRVQVPGAYNSNADSDFPVVYVLDGQWDFSVAADILGKLDYDGMTPPAITVAITWAGENVNYDNERQRDFLYSQNPGIPFSGGAEDFLSALETEILPYVEMLYRTDDHRTLMGASFGGLFTSYAMLAKPGLFDGYVALAAPYNVEQAYFEQRLTELHGSRALQGVRHFAAVGSQDFNEPQVSGFQEILKSAHLKGLKSRKKVMSYLGHAGVGPVGYTYGLQYVFERPRIRLDSATLDQYVGEYGFAPGAPALSVSYSGEKLLVQQGDTVIELYANSENSFYYPGVELALEFNANEEGIMIMTVYQQGAEFQLIKL